MVTSLVVVVAPSTGKIVINGLRILKEETICYKMVIHLHFVFQSSQSSEIVLHRVKLEFIQAKKLTFLKGAWHLKG